MRKYVRMHLLFQKTSASRLAYSLELTVYANGRLVLRRPYERTLQGERRKKVGDRSPSQCFSFDARGAALI